jgi:AraC family transcriptional regulator
MCAPADPFIGQQLARAEAGGFSFGHWISSREETVDPHGHAEAHFILITAGEFASEADGDARGAPLLIFNPAGTFHGDHFEDGGAFFSLKAPLAANEWGDELALPGAPTRVIAAPARAAIARLLRACLNWDGNSERDAEALCLEALGAAAKSSDERTPPRWLAQALDLLRDGETGSVAHVAMRLGVHPIHLARTFRVFHGCTPGEYLRRARVERAAALLKGSRRSLADVAHMCGFADQSHFTRAFQSALGVTPRRFRQMIR